MFEGMGSWVYAIVMVKASWRRRNTLLGGSSQMVPSSWQLWWSEVPNSWGCGTLSKWGKWLINAYKWGLLTTYWLGWPCKWQVAPPKISFLGRFVESSSFFHAQLKSKSKIQSWKRQYFLGHFKSSHLVLFPWLQPETHMNSQQKHLSKATRPTYARPTRPTNGPDQPSSSLPQASQQTRSTRSAKAFFPLASSNIHGITDSVTNIPQAKTGAHLVEKNPWWSSCSSRKDRTDLAINL